MTHSLIQCFVWSWLTLFFEDEFLKDLTFPESFYPLQNFRIGGNIQFPEMDLHIFIISIIVINNKNKLQTRIILEILSPNGHWFQLQIYPHQIRKASPLILMIFQELQLPIYCPNGMLSNSQCCLPLCQKKLQPSVSKVLLNFQGCLGSHFFQASWQLQVKSLPCLKQGLPREGQWLFFSLPCIFLHSKWDLSLKERTQRWIHMAAHFTKKDGTVQWGACPSTGL